MTNSRVIWTRASEDWQKDVSQLKNLKIFIQRVPCIKTSLSLKEGSIDASLAHLITKQKLLLGLKNPSPTYKLIVTSPKAGKYLSEEKSLSPLWQNSDEIITFGAETRSMLCEIEGKKVSLLPAQNAKELGSYLVNNFRKTVPFLCVGPEEPAFALDNYLCEQGFASQYVSFYKTHTSIFSTDGKNLSSEELLSFREELKKATEKLLFCFCSPSALKGLKEGLGSNALSALGKQHPAFVLGSTTQQAVSRYFSVIHTAKKPQIRFMVDDLNAFKN